MNDPTMWASFVAALKPFGWAKYVHENGRPSGNMLAHAESGAWARVTFKGDTLITEEYPNDRTTKVRRTNPATDPNWPATAKVWAERIGAQKIADKRAFDAKREKKDRDAARMRAIADSLAGYLADQLPGARPYVRSAGETSAEVVPLMPGSAYGSVQIHGPDDVRVYLDDVSGRDLAGIAAMVAAVQRWQESRKEATN